MEDFEIVKLKIYWGCGIDELSQKLDKETAEFVKAQSNYDNGTEKSIFLSGNDFDEVYRVLRPFIPKFPDIAFDVIYSGIEAGQDVFGRSEWEYGSLDEDEEAPEDIRDIVNTDDYEYASDWYAEWAESHEEETADWLSGHGGADDEFSFDGAGWQQFADAFPEAEREFFEMIESI